MQCSLDISPIIAGRSFHWKKEVDASFPGTFEVSIIENSLLLVNTISFEDYLSCVVVSEMSSAVPDEFIKAQAIAARSWTVCFFGEKHPGMPFDICNDDDCQRYHGVTFATDHALAVANSTAGEYLGFQEQVVPGYYSKGCGGYSESPDECFGFPVPGLKAVPDGETSIDPKTEIANWVEISSDDASKLHCSGQGVSSEMKRSFLGGVDDDTRHFRWSHETSKELIIKNLQTKAKQTTAMQLLSIIPLEYGSSGRITKLKFEYLDNEKNEQSYTAESQYELRSLLHESFLYSTAFTFIEREDSYFFEGAGWGHGVGLCQMGAAFQALKKRSYKEILKTYFPLTEIHKAY